MTDFDAERPSIEPQISTLAVDDIDTGGYVTVAYKGLQFVQYEGTTLYSWGYPQLGNKTLQTEWTKPIKQLASGGYHSLILTEEGGKAQNL